MEQKEFLKSIQACRRKLNIAEFLKMLVFSMCIGAGVGILFQVVAFCVPFYYANLYTGIAVLLGVLTAFVLAVIKRKTMKETTLFMDSFGFKERIVTAFEHLNEEGEMVRLQREDAMHQLEKHQDRIQVKLLPNMKRLACMLCTFLVLVILILIPSEIKKQAKELHLLQEEALEKEKEIEEVLEDLEELAQAELTQQQQAALQEMIESMQSSIQEYQQVASEEMLASANEKLDYKYSNMSEQLADMANLLQSGSTVSPNIAQAMQSMAENLQNMSNGSASTNTSLAGNQGQSGGESGNQSGNQQNNGQSGGSSSSGQSGNGQSGQSGNGQSGQGSGQSGDGQGNGQGSGDGSSQGSGNGQGTGGSAGSGRGEGSGSTPHDYVSIPNAIIDSGNLTGNASDHEDSDFFRAQNGLSWEGTHVSHEAVIGSYEQNAYEGISAGKYPSGMEEVIKEYFASFN